jgi:RimJ/RimL family protein N-acetyltransferase
LKAACSAEEWDPKEFSIEQGASFGAFAENGELKAIAAIEPWDQQLAHIGVVTHPVARNQGYATRAVALATEFALDAGLLPQYRVLERNLASRRVAAKLGFRAYGWTMAARLSPL